MNYNIISTGSHGNAVIVEHKTLIDCGVSYKKLEPYVQGLSLILLTHKHGDHLNKRTVSRIAANRPTVRFVCGKWLVPALIQCGVPIAKIDICKPGYCYSYKLNQQTVKVRMFPLTHNVQNCGYVLDVSGKRLMYATDTNNLNGISEPNCDVYMIEANHTTEDIKRRIEEKKAAGIFAYEIEAAKNHLSKEKADEWLSKNAPLDAEIVYMHQHIDKEEKNSVKQSHFNGALNCRPGTQANA